MEFNKISENTFAVNSRYYYQFRSYHFHPNGSAKPINCNEVMGAFIKTKFFLWQEEFRNEVPVYGVGKDTLADWNFHGLYDAKKMSVSSFDIIDFNEFVQRIMTYALDETEPEDNISEIETKLTDIKTEGATYYILKNLPEDMRHKWSVYDFFISGFACDLKSNTLHLFEFGLD